MENTASPTHPAPVRDLELESVQVGPATRIILLQANADGQIIYQIGRRRHHTIALPRQYAGARLLLLDSVRWALLLDPQSYRLEAVTFFLGLGGERTILMGAWWGKWINENGGIVSAISIPELMLQWNLPVTLYENRQSLGFEFQINIYNREVFMPQTLQSFGSATLRHSLELQFGYPLGGFRLARVKTEDEQTNRVDSFMDLAGFPLILPDRPVAAPAPPKPSLPPKPANGGHAAPPAGAPPQAAGPKPAAAPRPAPPGAAPAPERKPTAPPRPPAAGGPAAPRRPWAKEEQPRQPPPPPRPVTPAPSPPPPAASVPPAGLVPPAASAPSAGPTPLVGPPPRPLPRTEHLSINDMLTVIATERDPERRWKIIEANLTLGRPERTYPLIARYTELIGEQAAHWPPARLKAIFTSQPGSLLIGVMQKWSVNQVLAVVEGSGEPAKIIEWLREREIDRLLKLDLDKELISAESARRALHVDKHADEATIKKTWRTLLGFINADHGRSEERAIHRKKDEIAKHLQVARNILLKLF